MSIVSKVRLSSIFLPLAAVVSHSSLAMAQTGGGVPAPSVAPDNHSVLILSSTVVPDPLDPLGRSIEQLQAEAAGFTVVIGGAAAD